MIKCEYLPNQPLSCGWTKIDNRIQSSSRWLWITNVMEFIWCLITIFRLIFYNKRILVDKCFDCLIYLPVFDHVSGERRNQNVATSKLRLVKRYTKRLVCYFGRMCSVHDSRVQPSTTCIIVFDMHWMDSARYSDYGAKYVFDLILTIKCSRSIARIYNFQNIMDCVRQNKFCCIHKSLCDSREKKTQNENIYHDFVRCIISYSDWMLHMCRERLTKKNQKQTERRSPCRKWWINVNEFANVRNTQHYAAHTIPATMLSFTKHWISIFAFDLFIL